MKGGKMVTKNVLNDEASFSQWSEIKTFQLLS